MNPNLFTCQDMSQPIAATSATDFPKMSPIKPMRPLTAYHIFFQIEREYIIQTTPGAEADSSMHNKKSPLADAPRRYRSIKLSHDWYAGPGKRAKRKHRKSHGKIGFLELSRVVSQRWANLAEIDPETKAFVTKIAKRELEQYRKETKEYEALTKTMIIKINPSGLKPTVGKKIPKNASLPPLCNPTSTITEYLELNSPYDDIPKYSFSCHRTLVTPPSSPPPSIFSDFDFSSAPTELDSDFIPDSNLSAIISVGSSENDDSCNYDVDYSISYIDSMGHHVPSPSPESSICGKRMDCSSEDDSIFDPLFELNDHDFDMMLEAATKKRRTSCISVDYSASNELFEIWTQ